MECTSYSDARAMLPPDAVWSCSFGNPGAHVFSEYFRTAAGERWEVSNGKSPFEMVWSCKPVVAQ